MAGKDTCRTICICKYCRGKFKAPRKGCYCCPSPKCREEKKKDTVAEQQRRYWKKHKSKKMTQPSKGNPELSRIAMEARNVGLTYGNYVMVMGL